MNYTQEARNLVHNLDQRITHSAYDIAWMARLQASDNGDTRWPDLIEWLLEHQHPDGSWGGETTYYHDRILSTLIAAIALHENGRTRQAHQAIARGESYLWHNLHMLPHDPFELPGFELILPTLLVEARSLDLKVPDHSCGYGEIQSAKLRLIPPQMLYSPHISTVHSLEFLGADGDADQLRKAINESGSVGNSPAATAYYLSLCRDDESDERAMSYLEMIRERDRLATIYPFRTFETGWVLNNLILSGLPITELADRDVFDTLYTEMSPDGFALDSTFTVVNGSITSVCCRVLLDAGYDIDPHILSQFENPETHTFRTYNYERNVSTTTNVYALNALRALKNYPDQKDVQSNVAMTLLGNRQYNIYWTDKWHTSPYYATSHALVALLQEKNAMLYTACQNTINWIVHNQRDDGSWGFFQNDTAEETAYALTALLHYYRHKPDSLNPEILHRSAYYLAIKHQKHSWAYPELWLGKSIYAPHDIVRSAILAALILYEDTFGRLA